MLKAVLLIALYSGIIILPVMTAALLTGEKENLLSALGMNCGLTAFMIVILQFVTAARIKWTERSFGLDVVIRFHQYLAIFAALLLVAHPLLLAAGSKNWRLLTSLDLPWYIWLGKIGLLLVLANVITSKFQRSIGISFERWRLGHDIVGPLILVLVFVHSLMAGDDLEIMAMKAYWVTALTVALVLFVYHKFIRPHALNQQLYTVSAVVPESGDVWTIKLTPPSGEAIPPYLPGQFHFLTFHRGEGLPVEEHHWTISSSPADRSHISSTIKALGDFTSTMGRTKPGDTAAVHGPFGRFSHALHPEEKDLVFIAGGIGITPLMSMLRFMRDRGEDREVLLLYANRDEKSIVFRDELARMETSTGFPRLKAVHVLGRADDNWQGETGRVTGDTIDRYCGGDLAGKVFYLCGPPPMRKALTAALKKRGVADSQIRTEIFSFLD